MRTILILDDTPDLLESVCALLEVEGFRIIGFLSGREALTWLDEHQEPPDCILLDLMMPLMSGKAFAAEVRARPRLRNIPLVVMTAQGIDPEVPPGTATVVLKPFSAAQLLRALRSTLLDQ